MKKRMKVLAIALAVFFVASLCPIVSFAAEINELTLEAVVGSQSPYAITEDLKLPADYTWTSDSDVISIASQSSTDDSGLTSYYLATVNRVFAADKNVSLTATDSSSSTQSFDLTVKSKEIQVIASGTSAGGQADVFTHELDWGDTMRTIKTGSDNYYTNYQEYDYTNTNNLYDRYYLTNEQCSLIKEASQVVMEFDFNYTCGATGSPVRLQMNTGSKAVYLATWTNYYKLQAGTGNNVGFEASTWQRCKIMLDVYAGKVTVSIGNLTAQTTITDYLDNVLKYPVTSLGFIKGASSNDCGKMLVDNFCIYANMPTALSSGEQKEYIENLRWNDFSTQTASALSAGELSLDSHMGLIDWSISPCDFATLSELSYTSSDETVSKTVGKKLVLEQPNGKLNSSVILTATHKDGESSGRKIFNLSVMPTGYQRDLDSYQSEPSLLADFEEGDVNISVPHENHTTLKNNGSGSWWGSTNPTSFSYAKDDNKGMVGSLSGAGKHMWMVVNSTPSYNHNATLGMDIKFDAGSDSASTFDVHLTGALDVAKISIGNNKLTVHTGKNGTKDFTISTTDWFRLEVDVNCASRTIDIYVDGNKLNSVPLTNDWYYAPSASTSANILRYIKFYPKNSASLLVDNIAVLTTTNEDATKAEGAVKAAQLYYSGKTIVGKTLENNGPIYQQYNSVSTSFEMTGGAAISWSGKDITANVFSPVSPSEYEFVITATSGSETCSGTVVLRGAPTIINVDAEGKVTLTGESNGVMIVAKMDATENRLVDVKVYTNFDDISVDNTAKYKILFWENLETLVPLAFSAAN